MPFAVKCTIRMPSISLVSGVEVKPMQSQTPQAGLVIFFPYFCQASWSPYSFVFLSTLNLFSVWRLSRSNFCLVQNTGLSQRSPVISVIAEERYSYNVELSCLPFPNFSSLFL